MDLLNYIYNSIDVLVDLKAQEKYEERLKNEKEDQGLYNNENAMNIYESLLIKAEKDVRAHIRVSLK